MTNEKRLHAIRLAAGIPAGIALDAIVPDPPNQLHPVAWFGTWAGWLERHLYKDDALRGGLYCALAVAPAAAVGIGLDMFGRRFPALRPVVTSLVTWAVTGASSLQAEGNSMAERLDWGELAIARKQLGNLCSRDARGMDEHELARATVESMAENTSDAAVGSIFWGSVLGNTGMLVHRAANTLDAMVGYHNDRYEKFGKVSARLDDALNLVPARITGLLGVLLAPTVGGSIKKTARVVWRDARNHPSPNGGWCESAWAGAIDVRLGGHNVYPGGVIEDRGTLNASGRKPAARAVRKAARLVGVVTAAAAGIATAALVIKGANGSKSANGGRGARG